MKITPNSQPELPHNSRQKTRKNLQLWSWFKWSLTIGLSSSALAIGSLWAILEANVPASVDDVTSYARPETLTIKAADGTVLKEIGPVTHTKIKLTQVPDILPKTFVASEDRRFYHHEGVDLRGIARAAVANLKARDAVEGGSTITQQLSRIAFLNQEKRIWRKLKEMRIASKIETNLDKSQILETYLNLVYLGSGAYGVADAAWVYFGKTPQNLTIAEIATLAGLVPAPSVYSPFKNPQLATQQRNLVLSKMAKAGLISAEEATQAQASKLVTNRHPPQRLTRQASYFTDYIEQELPKYVRPNVLDQGGVVVETTLNPRWQTAAEQVVQYGLERYGKWQKFQQAALVSLDPRTGEIKSMVGGKDFGDNQYNRVTQAQRQPGSTFKTFVYTTAIASGFSPYKSYLDAEFYVDGYKPGNYRDKYRYAYVSIYDALTASINTIALQTMIDVGWKPTIEVAQKMGIKSQLKPTYSLALGSWEVNLLELTSAYGTLANKGVNHQPYGISKIRDRQGKVVYEAQFIPEDAVDEQTAAMMTWMLQGVVRSGTGVPAQIGRPAAGKTGTSDESRDLWYIGYIPQVTAGVWLGNDDNQPTRGTSGVAAEMWRKYMLEVVKGMPVESFPTRPPLTGRQITVAAEALKPKRSYHQRQPVYTKSSPQRYTSSSSVPASRSSSTAKPAPKATVVPPANPQPESQPTPIAQPAPVSSPVDNPFTREIPASHPINDPNRDWVKERLGR